MRAILVASLFVLPLASQGSAASAEGATLKGKVKVAGAECRGVKLIPRTAQSEREIAAMFGTFEPASRTVESLAYETLPGADAVSLGRDTTCTGWTQGFRFTKVAPGDYFLTALTTGTTERGASLGLSVTGDGSLGGRVPKRVNVYLMRTVSVGASDRTVSLDIKQD
ncbi:hypothetical protein [Sphingomonas humi]|uniref:Uncharacterized protein n=1 Tax=Sphingomonas humi TaxID=335630 RepID=A0ABP7S3T3_9SPHN